MRDSFIARMALSVRNELFPLRSERDARLLLVIAWTKGGVRVFVGRLVIKVGPKFRSDRHSSNMRNVMRIMR